MSPTLTILHSSTHITKDNELHVIIFTNSLSLILHNLMQFFLIRD